MTTLATRLDGDERVRVPVMCPMCHGSPLAERHNTSGDWQCSRCGQRWDTARLARVASYAAWVTDHDRAVG